MQHLMSDWASESRPNSAFRRMLSQIFVTFDMFAFISECLFRKDHLMPLGLHPIRNEGPGQRST